MDYVRLGRSDRDVSRIRHGCLTHMAPGSGRRGWTLDGDVSDPILGHTFETGIKFLDTAGRPFRQSAEGLAHPAVGRREHRAGGGLPTPCNHRISLP